MSDGEATNGPTWPWTRPARQPPRDADEPSPQRRPRARTNGQEADRETRTTLIAWGPTQAIADLRAAVRGSGCTRWRLDQDELEETAFHVAMTDPAATRTLTVDECRRLARHLASRAEAHRQRAWLKAETWTGCPFDVNRMVPAPQEILDLGRGHEASVRWKMENWGMADEPGRIEEIDGARPPVRTPDGTAAAGWRWRSATGGGGVLARAVQARWPSLRAAAR